MERLPEAVGGPHRPAEAKIVIKVCPELDHVAEIGLEG
jgi:hypothetical protein